MLRAGHAAWEDDGLGDPVRAEKVLRPGVRRHGDPVGPGHDAFAFRFSHRGGLYVEARPSQDIHRRQRFDFLKSVGQKHEYHGSSAETGVPLSFSLYGQSRILYHTSGTEAINKS